MEEQSKIPTSKVKRAGKFISTGAKVGGNYIRHYTKKVFNRDLGKEELHEANAQQIYDSLSELKGSALKVAQMISMEKNVLPSAYAEKFAMAQFNAPPLSYPLVVKTFRQQLGKAPHEVFDEFGQKAVNAASMGQVHQAVKDGQKLAVKVQYPGVADSVKADLRMVRPFALQLLNMTGKELDHYMEEVEVMLLQETDYELELRRSVEISGACAHLPNIAFARYFPELSSGRILTMSWLEGRLLKEFIESGPDQASRDKVGQTLWDFYEYQVHVLRQLHADPHPGNFIVQDDGRLAVIDFGAVKQIPADFYEHYFRLMKQPLAGLPQGELEAMYADLGLLLETDTAQERELFMGLLTEMIGLVGEPFFVDEFDFSDPSYFQRLYEAGDRHSRNKELRKANAARGSRHAIYVNRTYFGIYSILNQLGARVRTRGRF